MIGFQSFNYDITGCGSISMYRNLSLVDVHVNVFIKFKKFSVTISLKISSHFFLFSFFWHFYYVYVESAYWCPKYL